MLDISLDDVVESAGRAARAAGQLLIELQNKVAVREKGPKDLVTEADLASQKTIGAMLAADFPEIPFVGEEDVPTPGPSVRDTNQCCFVADPLDGTTNYVHGMDNYCVSIGLRDGDSIAAGVIYDPNRDLLFHATRGGGAYRNGEAISVSSVDSLRRSLVAASFSANVAEGSAEIDRFLRVLCRCQALRRMGSAALNLAYVAAGQLDGYWATSVKQWDVAAGLLLVEEAGGVITAIDGGAVELDSPKFLAASTRALHEELLGTLNAKAG